MKISKEQKDKKNNKEKNKLSKNGNPLTRRKPKRKKAKIQGLVLDIRNNLESLLLMICSWKMRRKVVAPLKVKKNRNKKRKRIQAYLKSLTSDWWKTKQIYWGNCQKKLAQLSANSYKIDRRWSLQSCSWPIFKIIWNS